MTEVPGSCESRDVYGDVHCGGRRATSIPYELREFSAERARDVGRQDDFQAVQKVPGWPETRGDIVHVRKTAGI